jgi:hypothetical protein
VVAANQSLTFEYQTLVSPNPSVVPVSSAPLPSCSVGGQFVVRVSAPNGGGTLNLIIDGATQPPLTPDAGGNATFGLGRGVHTVEYWASDVVGTQESPHHLQTVGVPCAPSISAAATSGITTAGASFRATVTPNGLPTSVHFEYGLDAKYSSPGSSGPVYDSSTAPQQLTADLASHTVSATVGALLPNALYHVRIVASNSGGSTTGADQAFTTQADPAPPPVPTIGKTFNAAPVSGLVLVRLPARHAAAAAIAKGQGFVPLTEVRQLPPGTQVDARQGTMKLVAAAAHSQHIGKTQAARFAGALFKIGSQKRSGVLKGLTTLSLQEGLFLGAPSFSTCSRAARDSSALSNPFGPVTADRLSRRVLQALHASGRGRFRTRGRYSSATVRGTVWDTIDRCDGTLTVVHRGAVMVADFKRRKTVRVRAGHSYLARAVRKKSK